MKTTEESVLGDTAIIVSDGCCVQLGNTPALDDVTFEVKKGKKVAVVGPNGGGKSTLFNAIAGLVPIVNGSLQINGMNPKDAKGTISYVPQKDLINRNFPLSVKQVVEMGLINKRSLNLFSRKQINSKIKEALVNVGLLEKINENINNLSGGKFQRILSLISDINLDGKTILVATHDINNLGEKFDEVLCLNRHCCAYGDRSEVLTKEVIEEMYGSHFEMFKTHTPESHMKNND